MSYQSLEFIIFCAAVIFFYYVAGRKRQLWILALANVIFYAIAGLQYLPFILITMVVTFFTGKKMADIYEKADARLAECGSPAEKKAVRADAKKKAKRVLIIGILVTVFLLTVCKYTTFVLSNVNRILGIMKIPQITVFRMILPLGISFYSFMALSYILDVYWKRYKAEKSFLMYAVYLSYFPHVVQGPIDRFSEFKNQISGGIAFDYKNLTFGAQLALWGFFKKLVIADRLGIFVDTVMDTWAECDGIILILAIVVYSIQIYADFSGCIDIVTGISEMMGIHLRKNFNHPYFAKTMSEFWRRWHISLQEWFKDYIYYPVSASKLTHNVKKYYKKKENLKAAELFSVCFPVLIVWMITGIWHGAAWRYVAWGMFHAALLIGAQIFEPVFRKGRELFRIDTENFGWYFLQMTRTYILCCIGRVFFRAPSLRSAAGIFYKMCTQVSMGVLFDENLTYGLDNGNVIIAIFAIIILWCADMLQEKISIRETLAKQNIVFRWMIIFGGLFAVIIFGIYGPGYDASSFIYEQF